MKTSSVESDQLLLESVDAIEAITGLLEEASKAWKDLRHCDLTIGGSPADILRAKAGIQDLDRILS